MLSDLRKLCEDVKAELDTYSAQTELGRDIGRILNGVPLLLKIVEAAEAIRWQRQAPGCLYEVDEYYVDKLRAALDAVDPSTKGGKL